MTGSSGTFNLSPEEARFLIRRGQSVIAEILLEATALQSVPLMGNWFASVGRDLATETGNLRSAFLQNLLQLVDTCHQLLVYLDKASAQVESLDRDHSAKLRSNGREYADRILSPAPKPPVNPSPGEPKTLLT